MSVQIGVTILILGIVLAGVLAVVASRWSLKMDRRSRRRQQRAIQRRRMDQSAVGSWQSAADDRRDEHVPGRPPRDD